MFDADEHFVVAPEAMNRFYANGFGGDVVASWMTSRDRLDEIDDFNGYLSNLYSKYEGQLSDECKKIVFGFSQGGTTLFRWLNGKVVACDHVLGYSCWFPEDIDLKESKTRQLTEYILIGTLISFGIAIITGIIYTKIT